MITDSSSGTPSFNTTKEIDNIIADIQSEYGASATVTLQSTGIQFARFSVSKQVFFIVQEYDGNTGDPIDRDEYTSLKEAEQAILKLNSPNEWVNRSAEHYAYIEKATLVKEITYDFNDGVFEYTEETDWDPVDGFEDLGKVKSFGNRESGAEDLLISCQKKLRNDISGWYEINGGRYEVSGGGQGKYGRVHVYDKNDDELFSIEIRIADHSYKRENRGKSASAERFISVVIANKDETRSRFLTDNLWFNNENTYNEVLSSLRERVTEFIEQFA